jgi:transposase
MDGNAGTTAPDTNLSWPDANPGSVRQAKGSLEGHSSAFGGSFARCRSTTLVWPDGYRQTVVAVIGANATGSCIWPAVWLSLTRFRGHRILCSLEEVLMPRKSRFSRSAQAAAVRLAREAGNSFDTVGRDLGVHPITVRRWARALDAREDPAERRAREQEAELVALRRRVRVLEEEREILAKAAAFLAQETGRTP